MHQARYLGRSYRPQTDYGRILLLLAFPFRLRKLLSRLLIRQHAMFGVLFPYLVQSPPVGIVHRDQH